MPMGRWLMLKHRLLATVRRLMDNKYMHNPNRLMEQRQLTRKRWMEGRLLILKKFGFGWMRWIFENWGEEGVWW